MLQSLESQHATAPKPPVSTAGKKLQVLPPSQVIPAPISLSVSSDIPPKSIARSQHYSPGDPLKYPHVWSAPVRIVVPTSRPSNSNKPRRNNSWGDFGAVVGAGVQPCPNPILNMRFIPELVSGLGPIINPIKKWISPPCRVPFEAGIRFLDFDIKALSKRSKLSIYI